MVSKMVNNSWLYHSIFMEWLSQLFPNLRTAGWWLSTPLKNMSESQLVWFSIPNCFWKVIIRSMVPNHQPDIQSVWLQLFSHLKKLVFRASPNCQPPPKKKHNQWDDLSQTWGARWSSNNHESWWFPGLVIFYSLRTWTLQLNGD